ncbi:MAG: hypothetical protein P1V97_18250 [Planctomycetota bacterium]|nr:hypothetical protein [Planctomycetota bacterium]
MIRFRLILTVVLSLSCSFVCAQEGQPKGKSDDDYVFARYNLRALHLEPRVDHAKSLGPERTGSGFTFYDEDRDFEDLIQFIEKNVAVGTWEDTEARIEQAEGSFRIYQTRAAHRELRKLWTYLEQLASPRLNVYFDLMEVPESFKLSAGDSVSKETRLAMKKLMKEGKAKRIWTQRANGRDGAQLVAKRASQQVFLSSYDYQELALTQSLAPVMEVLTGGLEIEVALTMAHSKMRFDVWVEELNGLSIENRTVGSKLIQCPRYRMQKIGSRFYGAPGECVVLSSASWKDKKQRVLLARIGEIISLKAPAKIQEIRRYPFRSICARSFKRNPDSGEVKAENGGGGGGAGGILDFGDEDDDDDSRLAEELFDSLNNQFEKEAAQLWRLGKTLYVLGPKDFQERVATFLKKRLPPVSQKISYELQILSVPDHTAPDSENLTEQELLKLTKAATKRKRVSLTGLAGHKAVLWDMTSIHYLSNVVSYQRIDKTLGPVLVPETNIINLGLCLELTGELSASSDGCSVKTKIIHVLGSIKEVSLGTVKVQLPSAIRIQRLNETCFFGPKSGAKVIKQSGKNGVTELIILKAKLATN